MRDALDGQFLEAAGFAEFLDEGFGLHDQILASFPCNCNKGRGSRIGMVVQGDTQRVKEGRER